MTAEVLMQLWTGSINTRVITLNKPWNSSDGFHQLINKKVVCTEEKEQTFNSFVVFAPFSFELCCLLNTETL